MTIFAAITNFGETPWLLALDLVLSLCLWQAGWRRGAVVVAVTLPATGLAIALLKIFFIGCHQAVGGTVRSPSGHTALSAAFYGTAALLWWHFPRARWRYWVVLGAAVLVAAIGASRVVLGSHTAAEVAVGFVIGGLAVAAAGFWLRRGPAPAMTPRLTALGFAVVLPFIYGVHAPFEHIVGAMTRFLPVGAISCRLIASTW